MFIIADRLNKFAYEVQELSVTEFEQWKQYINFKKEQGKEEASESDGAMLVKEIEG